MHRVVTQADRLRRGIDVHQDHLDTQLERTKQLQRRYTVLMAQTQPHDLARVQQELAVKVMRQVSLNQSLEAGIATMEGRQPTDLQAASLALFARTGHR